MTHTPDTTHTRGKRVSTPTTAQHPLDPFTANEIDTVRDVLTAAGLMTEHVRMAMLLAAPAIVVAVVLAVLGWIVYRQLETVDMLEALKSVE